MTRKLLPALLCAVLAVAPALGAAAAALEGVTLRDTYPLDGQTLVLNGAGLRTFSFLRIRVYVAGLYLTERSHDARAILDSAEPKVIVMVFLHGASKERISQQYHEGEQHNCGQGECDAADAADFERLVAATPGVEPGDSFTYVVTDAGLRLYVNARLVADIPNRDLGRRMLAGFIGDHPPTPELRRGLLGLPAG